MLFNEIIEKVTRENVDKITFYMVNNYHYDGKPSLDELFWLKPFIKEFGGRDGRGALTSPAGDTSELQIKFSRFWRNTAARDWELYRTQWLSAILHNEYGHEKQSARMASVLMSHPDKEHLIAFLSEQFPGNDIVVDLFEDVDGNTTPLFGDASKLSGDEYVGWFEGTRYLDWYGRTNYQWMFVSSLALDVYMALRKYFC